MYPDVSLYFAIPFVVVGLVLLAWSANLFVDGAAVVAKSLGINPFIVGMVIIGFGTSAPELCVSALSSFAGHSSISLGNAYGSDVFNIAAILGLTAMISPIKVKTGIVRFATPLLVAIMLLSIILVCAGDGFSRMDGIIQLSVFAVLLPLYCWYDQKNQAGENGNAEEKKSSVPLAVASLLFGLLLLVGSSHILVWGSVVLARQFGISELMIGLTVVGIGTSLPELASALASARKGQNEFVLGNIVGSNFFNTLAVVGLAGTISPFKEISPWVIWRDIPAVLLFTLMVAAFGFNWKKANDPGRINRLEGALWVAMYVAYLVVTVILESRPEAVR